MRYGTGLRARTTNLERRSLDPIADAGSIIQMIDRARDRAAPKPLSMFTTATPVAQLFSIAEQRRQAAEARAVADAGRHGDDRHARRGRRRRSGSAPFHARDDDDHARGRRAGRARPAAGAGRRRRRRRARSTALPMTSAVTAASSATGRSDVPAAATRMVPRPGRSSPSASVMVRARSWKSASGTCGRHGARTRRRSVRVTSRV